MNFHQEKRQESATPKAVHGRGQLRQWRPGNWRTGPEWAERPLAVQVALVEANRGRSPWLPVVVAAELEDLGSGRSDPAPGGQVVVPAQVAVVV